MEAPTFSSTSMRLEELFPNNWSPRIVDESNFEFARGIQNLTKMKELPEMKFQNIPVWKPNMFIYKTIFIG